MHDWLYTARERFTSTDKKRFAGYRAFSGFVDIQELVTLDSLRCPDLVDELRAEDWEHNVHQDFRTNVFRDADYLLKRQLLDGSQHQLVAALECPPGDAEVPHGFVLCGYDIMDSYIGNSALTNCGPIPEAFSPADVNNLGLIDDRAKAFEVRDKMRELQPDDPHLGACEVWLLARKIPGVE